MSKPDSSLLDKPESNTPMLNLWLTVRLMAEGSDWKRDQGETLPEWARRTLSAKAPSSLTLTHYQRNMLDSLIAWLLKGEAPNRGMMVAHAKNLQDVLSATTPAATERKDLGVGVAFACPGGAFENRPYGGEGDEIAVCTVCNQPAGAHRSLASSAIACSELPDMTESGWTPEQALRFYAEGRHFDVVDNHTRILDTGGVASDALKGMSPEYAASKGVELPPTSEHNEQWLKIARDMNRRLLDIAGAPESVDPVSTDAEEILTRAIRSASGRVLFYEDACCPSCGHNRDKSATSSIDASETYGMWCHYCQKCGAQWKEIERPVDIRKAEQ